jgi:nicotinate phosphoribosyltransferase
MEFKMEHPVVINSLADTDMYKLTMLQTKLHKFPGAYGKYRFKDRNEDIDLTPYLDEINKELDHLCTLRFTDEEIDKLHGKQFPYFKEDFVNWLEDFRPKRRFVHAEITHGKLDIWFEGPLIQVMMFELYVLKIVNEVYFRNTQPTPDYEEGERRLDEKIKLIKDYMGIDQFSVGDIEADMIPTRNFQFADFGTRRAFSGPWQRRVVTKLSQELPKSVFVGTSNVKLAMDLGITPIGSMAHEYIQMFQGLGVCTLADSQTNALQMWCDEYRGDLGIALSDTLGLDMFLKDFDKYFAKLFDGVRHDSGNPFDFADRMIKHYEKMGIDPKTKTIIFSDGLDVPLSIKIAEYCHNRIQVSFGIGTNLTNDLGYKPLQIVAKMIMCGADADSTTPVAKLSDTPAKSMCEDKGFIDYLRQVIDKKVNS